MPDLPADVSEGDLNHDDHHDALHVFYNEWRTYDPAALDAATLGGSTLAEVLASVSSPGNTTGTITGDGTTLTHPAISHGHGTTQLDVLVLTTDGQPLEFGTQFSYTVTTTTITVTIDRWLDGVDDSALPSGVTVNVFVRKASSGANVQTINTQAITTYTLALGDLSGIVEMSNASANTVTIPANATVGFPVGSRIDVVQAGVGQTTITPAAGVTLRSNGSLFALAGQWAVASLYKRATNEWVIVGALAP